MNSPQKERVRFREFNFVDAAANTIFPLAQVEVAFGLVIDTDAIWLVLIVVAEVDALFGVKILAKTSLLIALSAD